MHLSSFSLGVIDTDILSRFIDDWRLNTEKLVNNDYLLIVYYDNN